MRLMFLKTRPIFIITLWLSLPLPALFAQSISRGPGNISHTVEGINTTYYESMNHTVVMTVGLPRYSQLSNTIQELDVYAYYSYSGQIPTKPATVDLGLMVQPCVDLSNVEILVNGKRLYSGPVIRGGCLGTFATHLSPHTVPLTLNDFRVMTRGERVEIEVDNVRVRLREEHLDSFAKLVAMVGK